MNVKTFVASSILSGSIFLSAAMVQAEPTVTLAEVTDVENFFGTRNVKVAFTIERNLYYVDFTETPAALHKIDAVTDAAIPVISPDGNYIAYATGTSSDAATNVQSTAWIVEMSESATPVMVSEQGSGYVPRFVPGSLDPLEVVYATCASALDNKVYVWDGCGKVVAVEIVDGQPGQERDIYTGGSYLGGISYYEDYIG
ncbi:MAG: hypothetical protein GF401_00880, partial [Chitinivibrionales bacterium]|nr:hypothetical protein [Chitinivibrionales bacterium]